MADIPHPEPAPYTGPSYFHVFKALVANSLAREMTLRGSFLITVFTRGFWFAAQLMLFEIIYGNVRDINGWTKYEFFIFMATGMIINTLIEVFFMPNCANFSELIRTGNLDFVLLKPIDPQFLVSCGEKLDLGALSNLLLSGSLLYWGASHLDQGVTFGQAFAYCGLIAVGVTKLGYFWKLFPFIWGPCFVAYFLRDCHLLVVKLRILKRCDARQHRFSPGEFYSRFIRRKYAGHWR